jgi:hypothetical protein
MPNRVDGFAKLAIDLFECQGRTVGPASLVAPRIPACYKVVLKGTFTFDAKAAQLSRRAVKGERPLQNL